MNHEWILHILAFFAIAFFSGMFFPVFYAIIGAPAYLPHPEAELFEDAQVLGISKPGMIFREYGKWLCRKQNQFEEQYDKSRRHFVTIKCVDSARLKYAIETSYGRDRGQVQDLKIERSPNAVRFSMRLLPGEMATVHCIDEGIGILGNTLQEFAGFDRAKMPLSPYKALGLCNYCTVFWFMLAALLSACFVGIVPFSYLASFLILPAYGVAIWGSQLLEI